MLSISASNWKLVKQHHSRVIQQPLSRFTVCHKMGLGKQQCLEEKEPTQRITAGEQHQKEQRGIIPTWLLRSRLDDLIGAFQSPSFPTELQGSAARIQPPHSLINVSAWTESPQVLLRAHLQPLLIYLMRPWPPSGTTPAGTSQQAGAYAELVKVCAHSGQEAEGTILGCELETKKLCCLSVTQEDTHTLAAHQRN